MFDHFTFSQVDSSIVFDHDDDPRLSPRDMAFEPPSLEQTATPITSLADPDLLLPDMGAIENLVHRLSQQTSLRLSSDIEPMGTNPIINRAPTPTPTPAPTQQLEPNHPIHSLVSRSRPTQTRQQQQQLPDDRAAEDSAEASNCRTRTVRWQPEMWLRSKPSNPRALNLITDMVESGAQFNVQTVTPATPLSSLSSSPRQAHASYTAFIQPDDHLYQPMHDDGMDLEIDVGYQERDDGTLLSETAALRHASTPTGIRKYGLKYRSSADAARACKNGRKNTPRMRKRPKRNLPAST